MAQFVCRSCISERGAVAETRFGPWQQAAPKCRFLGDRALWQAVGGLRTYLAGRPVINATALVDILTATWLAENTRLGCHPKRSTENATDSSQPTGSQGVRMGVSHTIEIRVQYNETDGQGRVHHAQYLNYFERGRVELLRMLGHSYRDLEASGLMLVVAEMNIRYLGAALFDDVLHLRTDVTRLRGTRIDHAYEISRFGGDEQQIVRASSVVACVNRDGQVRRLPPFLRGT